MGQVGSLTGYGPFSRLDGAWITWKRGVVVGWHGAPAVSGAWVSLRFELNRRMEYAMFFLAMNMIEIVVRRGVGRWKWNLRL